MSYLSPVEEPRRRRVPVTRLTPDEAILKVNTIAEEANQKIRAAFLKVEYWMGLAEELGEALKEAAEENGALREQVDELLYYKERCQELEGRLSKVKGKAQIEQEEDYFMQRQKRKKR